MADPQARPITPADATIELKPLHPIAGKKAIYLIRHGHTKLNEKGQTSIDKVRGWIDIALDKGGLEDAEIIGEMANPLGIEVIACSDLKRTVQTAEVVGDFLGLPVSARTPAFRPWNMGSAIQGEPTKEVLPTIMDYMRNRPDEKIPPDGESFNSFRDRFLSGLQSIMEMIENGRVHRVAIITHFRGLKLTQGWIEAGAKPGFDIDTSVFTKNDMKPCAIYEINPDEQLKKWDGHILFRGFFNVDGKVVPAGSGS